MKLIYVAHKFGGDQENADRAEKLTAHLNLRINGAVFVAPWLPAVRNWKDSGHTRERGLEQDVACVEALDGLIVLSGMSEGVLKEANAAAMAQKPRIFAFLNGDDSDSDAAQLGIIQTWVNAI